MGVTLSSFLKQQTSEPSDVPSNFGNAVLLQQIDENVSSNYTSITSNLPEDGCLTNICRLLLGFIILWSAAFVVEIAIIVVSLQGTILQDHLRWPVEYLLYIKLGKVLLIFIECK